MDVSLEDVNRRNAVSRLAATNFHAALATARAITNGWYACQALASVAEHASDDRFAMLIEESFAAARRAQDAYLAVGAAAWPLGTIAVRGNVELLSAHISRLCDELEHVEPPASRSEAAFLLFQAVCPAGKTWWIPMFERVVNASLPSMHWRQARNLRDAFLVVAELAPDFANDALSRLDAKLRHRITTRLERYGTLAPRRF